MLGSVIGDGDGDAEAVGVAEGAAVVVDGLADGVGEDAAFGCVVHAVTTRTRRSNTRMRPASHEFVSRQSDLFARTLTIVV